MIRRDEPSARSSSSNAAEAEGATNDSLNKLLESAATTLKQIKPVSSYRGACRDDAGARDGSAPGARRQAAVSCARIVICVTGDNMVFTPSRCSTMFEEYAFVIEIDHSEAR